MGLTNHCSVTPEEVDLRQDPYLTIGCKNSIRGDMGVVLTASHPRVSLLSYETLYSTLVSQTRKEIH
jgi:hypothetical protein